MVKKRKIRPEKQSRKWRCRPEGLAHIRSTFPSARREGGGTTPLPHFSSNDSTGRSRQEVTKGD